MKQITKLFCLLMVLTLVAVFAASCGGSNGTATTTAKGTDPATNPTTDPATNPVTDPVTEPITDPITEPITDPITELPDTDGKIHLTSASKIAVYYKASADHDVASAIADAIRDLGLTQTSLTTSVGIADLTIHVSSSPVPSSLEGKIEQGDLAYTVSISEGPNTVSVYYNDAKVSDLLTEALVAIFETENTGVKIDPLATLELLYTKAQQDADYKKEQDALWETRFNGIENAELKNAVETFYGTFFDPDKIVTWWANLWDPENGGFYYANSSRDYEGFLPDMESTYQISNRVRAYLMGNTESLREFYGEEISNKIISFYQTKQDPVTGYFFHPQFPQTTAQLNTMRYSRDQDWAIKMLDWLDSAPLYETALDKLKNTAYEVTLRSLAASSAETVPAALSADQNWTGTKASVEAYVRDLFATTSCESWSNTLQTQTTAFQSAGVLGYVLDLLDETINPTYGLWVSSYDSTADVYYNLKTTPTSEVPYGIFTMTYKLMIMYNTAGRAVPYADKMAANAIKAILSRDPGIRVTYIYNPWATLNNLRTNITKYGDAATLESFNTLINSNNLAMLDALSASLGKYRCEDGSYSFLQSGSSSEIYGTYVSLGLKEGDVNATNLVVGYSASICNTLGISEISIFNYKHGEKFLEIVKAAKPIEKESLTVTGNNYDFEKDTAGSLAEGTKLTTTNEGSTANVEVDPTNPDNQVLRIHKTSEGTTNGTTVEITMAKKSVFGDDMIVRTSMDVYISSDTRFGTSAADKNNLRLVQIRLRTGGAHLVMPTFAFNDANNPTGFVVGVSKSTSGGYSKTNNEMVFTFDQWHKFVIEVKITGADTATPTFSATFLMDGAEVMTTDCFYSDTNYKDNTSTSGVLTFSDAAMSVQFQPQKRIYLDMRVDNMSTEFVEKKVYGFEKDTVGSLPANGKEVASEGTSIKVDVDPTNANNQTVRINKTNEGTKVGGELKLTVADKTIFADDVTVKTTMKVYIASSTRFGTSASDQANLHLLQLRFYTGSNAIFMPVFVFNSATPTGFVLGAAKSTSGNYDDGYAIRNFDMLFNFDTWYTMEVDMKITGAGTPEATFTASIKMNGVEVIKTSAFYDQNNFAAEDSGTLTYSEGALMLSFKPQKRIVLDMYIDDVCTEFVKD